VRSSKLRGILSLLASNTVLTRERPTTARRFDDGAITSSVEMALRDEPSLRAPGVVGRRLLALATRTASNVAVCDITAARQRR
jgi:hypothetical protein